MNQIEFEVGGKYENMKGIYEVLSLDGEYMQIRWENGEEITTEIDFQRRVIERMEFEREQLKAKKAKKAKKAAGGGRVKFEGLQDGDFSKKISGTTWRRRSCLGGAVKVFPDSNRFDIKSWSIARKPMIQWADVNHREPPIFNLQGKFFVRLDEEAMHCGYCIEHGKSSDSGKGDWSAFMQWVSVKENEDRLKEICVDHELTIYNLKKDGTISWSLFPDAESWKLTRRGKEVEVESLPEYLASMSKGGKRLDVNIAKRLEKEDAISRGLNISEVISRTFESLFPLYEASAVNGSKAAI